MMAILSRPQYVKIMYSLDSYLGSTNAETPAKFSSSHLYKFIAAECVSNASDSGLSHIQRHAIIWTIANLLSVGPLGTNLSEIGITFKQSSFTKIHMELLSAIGRPFRFDLNVFSSQVKYILLPHTNGKLYTTQWS